MEFIADYLKPNMVLILTLVLSIVFLYKMRQKSYGKLPPGPYPLPLLGTIYTHGVNVTADTLTEISKQYGGIFSVFLGPQRYIVLSSYDAIYEAMIRPEDFSHRGLFDKYTWRRARTDKMHGLWSKDYHADLIRDRKSCMGIMRKLGIGKIVMEEKILQEIDALGVIFRDKPEESLDLRDLINTSVGNITVHILLNKRFEHGDAEMESLLSDADDLIRYVVHATLIDSMPGVGFIPPFKGILEKFVAGSLGVCRFMKAHAIPLLETFDPDHTDSFIESYFESYYDRESSQVDVDIDVFKYILGDLMTGGTETSATSIKWIIVYLANRPAIQEKLYQEIITNTDINQPVRHSDRERLPYLEAFILEAQRCANIAPLILHKTGSRDTQLGGYYMPKNTMVLVNLHSSHMNEDTWGDPFVFRPERFIDENGKFVRHPHVIAFSIGKRSCPGEILAKQELYLFTGNLVKRFRFTPPEGIERIDEEPVKTSTFYPKPFKVNVIPR